MATKKTPIPTQPKDAPPVGNDADGAESLLSYRVTSPLRHDGQRYKIGDLVELTVEQFERLRVSGVVTDEAAEG